MAQPLPPVVIVFLAVAIVAMIPLSAFGIWHGWSTIQADQRMTAAGLTVEGRITRIDRGRDGTVSNPASGRGASVSFRIAGDSGGPEHWVTVRGATAEGFARGQAIVLRVDPANPDRHMLDRDYEVRTAWLFLGGFAVLLALSLGLSVWMLRGGFAAPGALG